MEEEVVLVQASNALTHCVKTATHGGGSSIFISSAEAVECHRLLLIARNYLSPLIPVLYQRVIVIVVFSFVFCSCSSKCTTVSVLEHGVFNSAITHSRLCCKFSE